MKCRRCGSKAQVDLKSHNTAFCRDCFFEFVKRQVERAISDHKMMAKEDKVLVCVSGGKDSLALWDILLRLGFEAHGLHLDLGIEEYSMRSKEKTIKFAEMRRAVLKIVDLSELEIPIPKLSRRARRPECSVCGIVKRYFFNRAATEGGYGVVATGHNLDDEAARLLGNLLHWRWDHLARQRPVLPARGELLVKKVQPLYRLSERETAAYAVLRGIDYILEECPMSRGATSIKYKHMLNILEDWMPGTKGSFVQGFLRNLPRLSKAWEDILPEDPSQQELRRCSSCGCASYLDPCNFCRLTTESMRPPK